MGTLAKPRRDLLQEIVDRGGKIEDWCLPVPSRRLATGMVADGLVIRLAATRRGEYRTWVSITDAGRAALQKA